MSASFFQVKPGKTWHAEAIMRRCELVALKPVLDPKTGQDMTVQIGLCYVTRFGSFAYLYGSSHDSLPKGAKLCRECKRAIRDLSAACSTQAG